MHVIVCTLGVLSFIPLHEAYVFYETLGEHRN